MARAIHNLSPRRDKLFVPLNCAAIPPELLESELFGHARGAFTGAHAERTGKFELADGGTLFLDEIGDMAYPLQAKLLRVLQEGVIERVGSNKPIRVDVRVVSSTNRDLAASIRDGTFREDLYYRLNVFHIQLPPLRERREDIAPLAQRFLREFGEELGKGALPLADDALPLLLHYDWPGNVRELRNLMERAAVLCQGPRVDSDLIRLLLPAVARQRARIRCRAAAARAGGRGGRAQAHPARPRRGQRQQGRSRAPARRQRADPLVQAEALRLVGPAAKPCRLRPRRLQPVARMGADGRRAARCLGGPPLLAHALLIFTGDGVAAPEIGGSNVWQK